MFHTLFSYFVGPDSICGPETSYPDLKFLVAFLSLSKQILG